jgi:hypothetical protein
MKGRAFQARPADSEPDGYENRMIFIAHAQARRGRELDKSHLTFEGKVGTLSCQIQKNFKIGNKKKFRAENRII